MLKRCLCILNENVANLLKFRRHKLSCFIGAARLNVSYILLTFPLLISFGCVQTNKVAPENESQGNSTLEKQYKGKVTGKSGKGQTLKLLVRENDNFNIITIPYTQTTKGMGHAVKGKYILVTAKKENSQYVATVIKPSLTGLIDGVSTIQIDDLENLLNTRKDFSLIDTREPAAYEKSHLPTAQSLPACQLEKRLKALPEAKQKMLVFYCYDDICGSNNNASTLAVENGYKKVKVFKKGLKGWLDEGNKTVASDQFVNQGNLVLIDLRTEKKFTAKRINQAVSIPFESLASRLSEIPVHAPVVVYSDSFEQSRDALELLHKEGIRSVAMVNGNLYGWKKRGNPTVSGGTAVSTISWQHKPGKGEISVQKFLSATGKSNVQIIDVRTAKETASGKLPGAQHIPFSELSKKLNTIPADKTLYIYSSKGARAEMASRFLRERGFDTWFVLADVRCTNGQCRLLQ